MKCKCGNVKNVENVENENRKTIRALVASLFENGGIQMWKCEECGSVEINAENIRALVASLFENGNANVEV